ncbi:hypothetical protein [Sphingomonas carotinifaciens]|uniref:hypothetical protein n=1 Tax=Sphingomonas carotinifaciens TaxID=1166323 RepID=UPI000DD8472A|nr:hypothetical protein [Sphingomonas carotinifaciens]
MPNKTLGRSAGLGLGGFAVAAIAWVVGTRFVPELPPIQPAAKRDTNTASNPAGGTAAPLGGDRDPRTALDANLPSGQAEAEKHFYNQTPNPAAEHVPTDLMGDRHPGNTDRAVAAFRPDPTATPTEQEKEALRPATGPAPTLVADRGSGFSEGAGAA